MSRVALVQRLAGRAVIALATLGASQAALAADFEYFDPPQVQRPYAPPPVVQYERQTYVPPAYPREHIVPHRHAQIGPDDCRLIVKRYQDSYGREVTRQTRDCGERDYSAIAPRPIYLLPHERYRPYDANPRPEIPDADDLD